MRNCHAQTCLPETLTVIAFHVERRTIGHWWHVVDNTGLSWTRDLPSAREAFAALRVLRAIAHSPE
jgi:hypothetical protein